MAITVEPAGTPLDHSAKGATARSAAGVPGPSSPDAPGTGGPAVLAALCAALSAFAGRKAAASVRAGESAATHP